MTICHECGVPFDEIPSNGCISHRAYGIIEQEQEKRARSRAALAQMVFDKKPIWDKLREAEDLDEVIELLATWLETQSKKDLEE